MSTLALSTAIIGTWLISFLITGVETGLFSLDRIHLRGRVKKKEKAAMILNGLLREPDRHLSTLYAANTLMQVGGTVLFLMMLNRTGWGMWSSIVPCILYLSLYIWLVRMLPKTFFRRHPLPATLYLAHPVNLIIWCFQPLAWISIGITRLVMRLVGSEQPLGKIFVTRDEIKMLAREKVAAQDISHEEKQMIGGVFDFRYTKVHETMVTRDELVTLSPSLTREDAIRLALARNVSRLPVLDEQGQLLGIVSIYDMLFDPHPTADKPKTVADYQRRVLSVDEDEAADAVLRKLGVARQPLAVVKDQRGEVTGLVTLEDLTEKIIHKVLG